MTRKLAAEFIGTAWLVLGGCGSAVLAAAFPQLGIGFVGVAFAFGLTVLTMAYAIGHVSGCHLNPAVSVGLWAGGRFPLSDLPGYVIAQVLGGIAGAGILYLIASGHAGFDVHAGFASNGYGEHSPGGYSMAAALICEIVMTFAFLFVILGSTHGRAPAGFARRSCKLEQTDQRGCRRRDHDHYDERRPQRNRDRAGSEPGQPGVHDELPVAPDRLAISITARADLRPSPIRTLRSLRCRPTYGPRKASQRSFRRSSSVRS